MSAGTAPGPCVGVTLARAARNAMNSATTKTSAIDHLAIVSTNASVRLPPVIAGHEDGPGDERGLDERNDHAEQENERGGDGTSDLVQAPNRSDNAARLLVDHDLPKVLLQRCRDLRREFVEHALAQVAARAFDERDDCRVHHRLEHVHRVIGQSPLQYLGASCAMPSRVRTPRIVRTGANSPGIRRPMDTTSIESTTSLADLEVSVVDSLSRNCCR